ncbi:hypothetical protein [Mesorhizobium sp. M1322]|uniref:hypothetical protein n=1 Tax=Mesorhizobium sp. M1322 TaxID=2957081 RepID=UPI0033350E08
MTNSHVAGQLCNGGLQIGIPDWSKPPAPCELTACRWSPQPRTLSTPSRLKIGRADLIQIVLREWLETNAYLPVRTIDEESETDGSL